MASQNVFRSQYKELSEDEKVLIDNIKNKAEELLELIKHPFPPSHLQGVGISH